MFVTGRASGPGAQRVWIYSILRAYLRETSIAATAPFGWFPSACNVYPRGSYGSIIGSHDYFVYYLSQLLHTIWLCYGTAEAIFGEPLQERIIRITA